MPEYRVESYVRLCRELSIPILSPEIVAGGVFTPRRVDPPRGRRHEPHRRGPRRHHRGAQDGDRLRGLRPPLRDAHGGLGQPSGLRGDHGGHLANTTRRACSRRASTTTRPTPTSRTPATRSTPTAMSTMPKGPAWATRSSGTTSTTTSSSPELTRRTRRDRRTMSSIRRTVQMIDLLARQGPAGRSRRGAAAQAAARLGAPHAARPRRRRRSSSAPPTASGSSRYRLLEITGLHLERIQLPRAGAAVRRADRRGDARDGQRHVAQRRARHLHRQGARQRGHAARHARSARAARSIAAAPARRCWPT